MLPNPYLMPSSWSTAAVESSRWTLGRKYSWVYIRYCESSEAHCLFFFFGALDVKSRSFLPCREGSRVAPDECVTCMPEAALSSRKSLARL